MREISYMWNILNRALTSFENIVDNKILQIILVYWIIFLLMGIIIFTFRLIIYLVYEGISRIYRKFKHSKNIILIRWEVELKVFFERIYFNFKIYKVKNISFDNNEFRLSRKYAPSGIIEVIVSVIKRMITLDFYNFLIWLIVIIYKFKISNDDINKVITVITLDSIIDYLKGFNLNDFTELLKNISFLIIGILIITGIWSYSSTYKKISKNKLEKVLEKHDKLINILASVLYKLEENINILLQRRDYIPNYLYQLITYTDNYFFEDGKVTALNDFKIKHEYKNSKFLEQQFQEFSSYNEDINKLKELIKDIERDNLWRTFNKAYKNILFELIRLEVISKEPLQYKKRYLLDRDDFIEWIISLADKNLIDRFKKIVEVENGIINKQEYEKEESIISKSSYDELKKFYEEKLKEKIIKFSESIDSRLKDSIETYLILERCLNKLEKFNKKLELLSKLKLGDE